jgi:hypothetical protein
MFSDKGDASGTKEYSSVGRRDGVEVGGVVWYSTRLTAHAIGGFV